MYSGWSPGHVSLYSRCRGLPVLRSISRSISIHVEVRGRVIERRGYRNLSRKVIDLGNISDGIQDGHNVSYVPLNDREFLDSRQRPQPIEIVPHAAAREIIEDARPNASLIQETFGKI